MRQRKGAAEQCATNWRKAARWLCLAHGAWLLGQGGGRVAQGAPLARPMMLGARLRRPKQIAVASRALEKRRALPTELGGLVTVKRRAPRVVLARMGMYHTRLRATVPAALVRPRQRLGARRMADALLAHSCKMDPLGFEPRAFRMRSGCDTTTP
jgi:hypothetical protein